jgi:RNA polymerase sigma-70 factor, ECF subfamily
MKIPDANDIFSERSTLILIEEILAGNQGLFEQLIQSQEWVIRGVLRQYLNCQEDVHDAMQTTWIKVWRNLGGFRGQSKFRSWVVRIAINEALQLRRRRAQAKWVPMDSVVTSREVLIKSSTKPSIRDPFLNAAIDALPAPYNRALAMHVLEGLTDAELASSEAISLPAAKSRLRRARLLMRESWDGRRRVELKQQLSSGLY